MKAFIIFGISMTSLSMLLPCCQPVPKEDKVQKRVESLEQSVAVVQGEQEETEALLQKILRRQERLKQGILRAGRLQKNDRTLIHGLRHDLEYDADKLDEMVLMIGKMIDAMQKMRAEISHLRAKVMHLRQGQSEMVQQLKIKLPSSANSSKKAIEAPSGAPVDLKKKKKVLESVAFLSTGDNTHA